MYAGRINRISSAAPYYIRQPPYRNLAAAGLIRVLICDKSSICTYKEDRWSHNMRDLFEAALVCTHEFKPLYMVAWVKVVI